MTVASLFFYTLYVHCHRMGSQSSPIQASIPSEEYRMNEQESTRTEHWQVSPSSLSNEIPGLSQSQCVLTVMTFCCFELTAFKSFL